MTQPSADRSDAALAEHKLSQLIALLRELGSLVVCYSGGIDSTLLLALAHRELGVRAVGLTAVSPSLAPAELTEATAFARSIGARLELVDSREMERPGYVANGPDRCYHCKTELYSIAEVKRQAWGLDWVANGSNLDDLGDYRPGLEAAREARIRSPFVEVDMGKGEIRAVARLLGLEQWDKPAAACLASRLPYGTAVTPERLGQIAGFEAELRGLGFRQLRVRWHEQVARIELGVQELPRAVEPDLREAMVAAGRRHGFQYITLDLLGYRTGSHNEVLKGRSLKVVV